MELWDNPNRYGWLIDSWEYTPLPTFRFASMCKRMGFSAVGRHAKAGHCCTGRDTNFIVEC